MKKIYTAIMIVIITIMIPAPKTSAQTFDTTYARILQNRIEQLRSNYSLVGITAAALVPGQGIWTGASGINSSDSDDITTDMVMGAGSITKNFIATLILQLAEFNKISLSDSLGKWLPPYTNVNSSITIKQLLDHSSGLYNVTDNPSFLNAINANLSRHWTIEEVMTGGYVLNPYFNPGAGFHYSNTGYMLLGLIIEGILKDNLSHIFHQRIYTLNFMSGSFFEIDDTLTKPYAHNWADITGTGVIEDAFWVPKEALNSSTIGAGGVITRPEDLLKWMDNLYGGNILTANSLSQMLTFRNVSIAGGNGYGLGTIRYAITGGSGYGHGGNSFGYTSVMIYDPHTHISIAIMMNKDLNGGPAGINFMNTAIQNNPVGIQTISNSNPDNFSLYQNYPNPFNPSTKIKFDLQQKENVNLSVLNALGQQVEVLYNGTLSSGTYSYNWNASAFTSGVYFYKLKTETRSEVKKMLLIK